MTYIGLAQIAVFTALIAGLTKPFGLYMARVFAGERTVLRPVLGSIEKILYRVAGVDSAKEQTTPFPFLASTASEFLRFMRCRGCRFCCRSIPKR